MEIIAGVIAYVLAISVFIASGKFLKDCDEKIKTIRRNQ